MINLHMEKAPEFTPHANTFFSAWYAQQEPNLRGGENILPGRLFAINVMRPAKLEYTDLTPQNNSPLYAGSELGHRCGVFLATTAYDLLSFTICDFVYEFMFLDCDISI